MGLKVALVGVDSAREDVGVRILRGERDGFGVGFKSTERTRVSQGHSLRGVCDTGMASDCSFIGDPPVMQRRSVSAGVGIGGRRPFARVKTGTSP
jgi:hypothetical protein